MTRGPTVPPTGVSNDFEHISVDELREASAGEVPAGPGRVSGLTVTRAPFGQAGNRVSKCGL